MHGILHIFVLHCQYTVSFNRDLHSFSFSLLQKILNDALMGILRVQNLISPPYVSTQPSLNVHRISKCDRFVIVGSDGLFDFFSNDEAVELVNSFILSNPYGDPAKFLVEQLVIKAANRAGKTFQVVS